METFDHLLLVRRDPRELARLRRLLLGARPGGWQDAKVMHEVDDSCCRRESWDATLAAIQVAVCPPTRVVATNIDCRS